METNHWAGQNQRRVVAPIEEENKEGCSGQTCCLSGVLCVFRSWSDWCWISGYVSGCVAGGWPDSCCWIVLLSCQMLARPTDAVDHIVRCLAGWADAGQTDTDPLVIWLGVWQCGRPEACWASCRCAVGWLVWGNRSQLAGWLVGALQGEWEPCCLIAVVVFQNGYNSEWEHTKGDSEK